MLLWLGDPWETLLALGGTTVVAARIAEVPAPTQAWLAWGLTWLAAVAEVRAGWWSMFLLGLNQPVAYARCNGSSWLSRPLKVALLLRRMDAQCLADQVSAAKIA